MIDKLRDEIIESEKARTDLIKWKLILVAAIGSVSLGIGSSASPPCQRWLLLALIPFVCLYVDAVCFHNEIRIMTIARFLRIMQPADSVERQYEEYCKQHRMYFSLEAFALLGTTVVLSVLVSVIGLCRKLQIVIGMSIDFLTENILVYSGFAGTVAGILFYVFYRSKTYKLDNQLRREEQ